MNFKNIRYLFTVHSTNAPLAEKIKSGVAGGVAIFLLALAIKFLPLHTYPILMLGSMAASAVLLFAIPHSPLAQPWNFIGGHFISALAGWITILLIHDPLIAAGVGVGAAIFLMHYFNCLHPPGAATGLTLILSSTHVQEIGWKWVLLVLIVNTGVSLILALVINKTIPGRQYPMRPPATPPKPSPAISLEQRDLEWALEQMKEVIDVSEEDLAKIYQLAQSHAQERNARP
jgi:CBS domain-containing membrane protein